MCTSTHLTSKVNTLLLYKHYILKEIISVADNKTHGDAGHNFPISLALLLVLISRVLSKSQRKCSNPTFCPTSSSWQGGNPLIESAILCVDLLKNCCSSIPQGLTQKTSFPCKYQLLKYFFSLAFNCEKQDCKCSG